jgi:hypothetical protein
LVERTFYPERRLHQAVGQLAHQADAVIDDLAVVEVSSHQLQNLTEVGYGAPDHRAPIVGQQRARQVVPAVVLLVAAVPTLAVGLRLVPLLLQS